MLEKIIDTDGFNAVVKGRHGYFVYNKNDVYIGRSIEKYGEWSEAEVELFKQFCRPGDIVVEVGANIGTHTLALANMVGPSGKVYAFEAQPIVHQQLSANLALNSIFNVESFQMALSDKQEINFIPNLNYAVPQNFGALVVDREESGIPIKSDTLDNRLKLTRLKLLNADSNLKCIIEPSRRRG